jgi:hypothetical protein
MSTATTDEKPKRSIAKRVVTPKRKYFVPEHGVTVEANDVTDAVEQAKKLKQEKEGDV